MVPHQVGGELEARHHVVAGQGRVFFENIFDGVTRRKEFENRLNRNPRSFDDGLAITDIGIDEDAFHSLYGNRAIRGGQ